MKFVFWNPRHFWRLDDLLTASTHGSLWILSLGLHYYLYYYHKLTLATFLFMSICFFCFHVIAYILSFSTSVEKVQLIIIVPTRQSCLCFLCHSASWAAHGHRLAVLDPDAHSGSGHWPSITQTTTQSSSASKKFYSKCKVVADAFWEIHKSKI